MRKVVNALTVDVLVLAVAAVAEHLDFRRIAEAEFLQLGVGELVNAVLADFYFNPVALGEHGFVGEFNRMSQKTCTEEYGAGKKSDM